MKKTITIILAILLLSGCTGNITKPTESVAPTHTPIPFHYNEDEMISREEMIEDIDYLKLSIQSHPKFEDNTEAFVSVEEHIKEVKSNLLEQMNLYKFYFIISSIISYTDDPHSFSLFNISDYDYKYWLDFEVSLLQDTIYISKANDYFDVGDEIIAIGSYDYDVILNALDDVTSNSNEYGLKYISKRHLQNLFFYDYLGVIDDNGYVEFTIKKANKKEEVLNILMDNMISTEPRISPDPYSYYIDQENGIGYVDTRTCNGGWDFKEFMEAFYTEVNEKNIEKIVIDIRNNPGGSADFYQYLIMGMDIDSFYDFRDYYVKNHFKMDEPCSDAEFYLFVSGGSVSCSIFTEAIMKRNGLATIVGTTPGDITTAYLPYDQYQHLPNTGLYYKIGSREVIITCVDEVNIQPDVFIEYTVDDIINGTDPYMEWVKQQ